MTKDQWKSKHTLMRMDQHNRQVTRGPFALASKRDMFNLIHYGYTRATRRVYLGGWVRTIRDPDGTPLDRLLAWEAVEERCRE